MRKQDFDGTEKWLTRIKNPESALIKKQVGYYNYLFGIVYSQRNLTTAEKYFIKAIGKSALFSFIRIVLKGRISKYHFG